jgi:hypothetical protein
VILERVITKPPSAELRANQTDQDSLPPYEELDAILQGLVEQDLSARELVEAGHDPAVVRRVSNLLDLAEYKRRQAPPGVKITRKAFGRDRRYPRSPTPFARSGSAAWAVRTKRPIRPPNARPAPVVRPRRPKAADSRAATSAAGRRCRRPWPRAVAVAVARQARGEDLPAVRHALQGVGAAMGEVGAGAGRVIPDRARDEDLAGCRERRDPRPDVERDPGELVALQAAIAGMDAGADLEPEPAHGRGARERAAHRRPRVVEAHHEAVPGRVDLASAPARDLCPDDRMVPAQQRVPPPVAGRARARGGIHDVGEQQGQGPDLQADEVEILAGARKEGLRLASGRCQDQHPSVLAACRGRY